ncbi:MAG TPA: hypothetical protein VN681_13445 [Stellaceae bacterium]|nr:hypothetical protein [Stellaceae bacterium]
MSQKPAATVRNFLSVRFDGKGIPYGGNGEVRPDGGANFGFKNLKSDPSLISSIPELESDASLKTLVDAINRSDTGLFSVGCASGDVQEEQGYRRTGYIEFAINSKIVAADARSYFPAFFHFERTLFERQFQEPVQLSWELQPATFIDAGSHGFTSTIYINTFYFASPEAAGACWAATLGLLGEFLGSVPPQIGEPIYLPARTLAG